MMVCNPTHEAQRVLTDSIVGRADGCDCLDHPSESATSRGSDLSSSSGLVSDVWGDAVPMHMCPIASEAEVLQIGGTSESTQRKEALAALTSMGQR